MSITNNRVKIKEIFETVELNAQVIRQYWREFCVEVSKNLPDSYQSEIERLSEDLDRSTETLIDKLRNPVLTIATTGTTSSGKSTLVNMLCEANVMPAAVGEMSAGAVTITHSAEKLLIVHQTSGAKWQCGEWKNITDDEIRSYLRNAMESYHAHKQDPNIESPRFDLYYPLKRLREQVLFGLQLPEGTDFDGLLKPSLKDMLGFVEAHDFFFDRLHGFVINQIKMSKENLIKAAIAASIVLVIAFLYRGKKANNKPQSQINQDNFGTDDTGSRSNAREVSLCLILKSKYLGDLLANRNVNITNTRLKELIDQANYFLCIDIGNVSNLENKWSIAQVLEPDNDDEDANVYVRVNITNGQEMINATYPYALSEGILPSSKVKLEKISYLKDMSLIHDFRRP